MVVGECREKGGGEEGGMQREIERVGESTERVRSIEPYVAAGF